MHRFFAFSENKLLQNLYPFSFYAVLHIAVLKETKVHAENSVIFGRYFFKKTNFLYFKQNLIVQCDHIKCNASF